MTGLDDRNVGTGRTTRTVAAAVAAAARGRVYLVAATHSEVQRLARLVREAAPDPATAQRVSVIDPRSDLLDTRDTPWRVRGSHAPVYADHYAAERVRDDASRRVLHDAISIAKAPHSGLVAVYVVAAHPLHGAHLRGLLRDLERSSTHDIMVTYVGPGAVRARPGVPELIDPYALEAERVWRETGEVPNPDTYGALLDDGNAP